MDVVVDGHMEGAADLSLTQRVVHGAFVHTLRRGRRGGTVRQTAKAASMSVAIRRSAARGKYPTSVRRHARPSVALK